MSKKLLLGRFTVTPVMLFRVQAPRSVVLRLEHAQKAAGRTSFDITMRADGRVHPATDPCFLGPNGMSMRPLGAYLMTLISSFKGKVEINEVPAGTPLPPELVLLHEHTDHYSMQPAVAMLPAELTAALTAFLAQPRVEKLGKAAFFERHKAALAD